MSVVKFPKRFVNVVYSILESDRKFHFNLFLLHGKCTTKITVNGKELALLSE